MHSTSEFARRIEAFGHFIHEGEHPCAMARAVVAGGTAHYGHYASLGSEAAARSLCADLPRAAMKAAATEDNWSFVAFFAGAPAADEQAFETALWQQLQQMHDMDRRRHAWDPEVDPDPSSPNFSFSIGGRAYYVIGLHPRASRLARRFDSTVLVFNPHRQFQQLRERGRYAAVKTRIRDRDRQLQGFLNPMLADHGERSEARQYSGRAVGEDWRCPLRH